VPDVDGSPSRDVFHLLQPQLLRETFKPSAYPPDQVFTASGLNLYYDPLHPLWYKRPDWFAVVGVSRLYEQRDLRLSYVIWQEGVDPFIVVELLSPGTEKEDLGQTLREVNQRPTKWEVYEQILRVPYYVVFDRLRSCTKLWKMGEKGVKPIQCKKNGYSCPRPRASLPIAGGDAESLPASKPASFVGTVSQSPRNSPSRTQSAEISQRPQPLPQCL
jgi:Uma2 family endonuclease